MHFHGPAPHVEGSDVVRGVRFKNVSPVSWSCYPPGSQPRKDGVRLHSSYDISGSVLQVALYLWRGHLSPSQEGGALLLNKIPTSNIVSLCQYSMVSRGRIWRWPGRRKLIHLPGIVGWLQQMDSLGYWPHIAWSRHAIRMFRDRNLGLISVLRNKIGSYTELNCWVAPSPMHLSRVVLDLAEGDILLLCSRPCSFAYQIGKALMVWVTLNDRLFKQPLHPSMHTSGCHTTLISALEP